jgi:hypothetical protein
MISEWWWIGKDAVGSDNGLSLRYYAGIYCRYWGKHRKNSIRIAGRRGQELFGVWRKGPILSREVSSVGKKSKIWDFGNLFPWWSHLRYSTSSGTKSLWECYYMPRKFWSNYQRNFLTGSVADILVRSPIHCFSWT